MAKLKNGKAAKIPFPAGEKPKSVDAKPGQKVKNGLEPSPARKPESRRKRILAGVIHDGSRHATVDEILDPKVKTRSAGETSLEERKALCLRRIRSDSSFVPMRMFGVKAIVDRKRAMKEIAALSPLGMRLMELQLIQIAIEIRVRLMTQLGGGK